MKTKYATINVADSAWTELEEDFDIVSWGVYSDTDIYVQEYGISGWESSISIDSDDSYTKNTSVQKIRIMSQSGTASVNYSLIGFIAYKLEGKTYEEGVDDQVAELIQNGTGISWSYDDEAGTLTPTISLSSFSIDDLGTKDHDLLNGLSDDDHDIYALLAGRDGDVLNIDQIKAFDGSGLLLTDDGNTGIFVKDGGNIGINETDPDYLLDITGGSIRFTNLGGFGLLFNGGNSDTTLLRVSAVTAGGNPTALSQYGFSIKYMGSRSGTANSLSIFPDNSSGTAFEAFTLFQDGKLGLSTTTPKNILDIKGACVIGSSYAGVKTAPASGLLVEGRLGVNTDNPFNALHVVGTAYIEPTEVTVASKNKSKTYIKDSVGNVLVYHTEYWDGDSYESAQNYAFGHTALANNIGKFCNGIGASVLANNEGSHCNGFGYGALLDNVGSFCIGMGSYALQKNVADYCTGVGSSTLNENEGVYSAGIGYKALYYNTGDRCNGFGYASLYDNTGIRCSGFGHDTMHSNAGDYCTAIGYYSMYFNVGDYCNGFGTYTLSYNSGDYCNAIGDHALTYNAGDDCIGIGRNVLYYNQGNNNIVLGKNSFFLFNSDTANDVTFDYTDITVATDRVTITGHGLGDTGVYVNVLYTEGTSEIVGLTDGLIYQIKIVDENTIGFDEDDLLQAPEITDAGSGTGHTLTPQFTYENVILIGNELEPDQSNLMVLGYDSIELTKLYGDSLITYGGHIVKTDRLTSNTELDATYHDVFCDTDGGAFTVTLPATPTDGQYYRIINTGSSGNALTIDENGKSLIGSVTTVDLADGESLIITYETTEGWW